MGELCSWWQLGHGDQAQFELGLEGNDGRGPTDTRKEGMPGKTGQRESRCELGMWDLDYKES